MPDATTLLKFRRLLETHKLGEQLFAEVGRVLQASGMELNSGTIVDATPIAASSSTEQKALIHGKVPKARDFANQRTRRAGGELDEVQHDKNRNKSKIRARVEHVFAVAKRLWGFTKVRYRG